MEKSSFEAIPETPQSVERRTVANFESAINLDITPQTQEKEVTPATWKKLFKSLQIAVAATIAACAMHHAYEFRDKTSKTEEDSKWSHNDKETEHILNTLSGKESFTESEKAYIARYIITEWCEKKKITSPQGINQWDTKQIEYYISTLPKDSQLRHKYNYVKNWVIENPIFMKHIHEELWKTEKACGSPYIRWQKPEDSLLLTLSKEKHREHYNSVNNTIYLAPEDLGLRMYSQFLAEASHAEQFKQSPLASYTTAIANIGEAALNAVTHGTSFSREWDTFYDTPGTLEFDAHSIREKKLTNQFNKAESADVTEIMEKSGVRARDHF